MSTIVGYINTETDEYPIAEQAIRELYPNVSFEYPFVAPGPFAAVYSSEQPAFDKITQAVVEGFPVADIHGEMVQSWEVVALPESQVLDNQATAQAKTIAIYEKALDDHLDAVASIYRFADRHSLALRAGYPSSYQALGLAFGTWMDGCNAQAYATLQAVIDGQQTIPTLEQFIASLPEFVAP